MKSLSTSLALIFTLFFIVSIFSQSSSTSPGNLNCLLTLMSSDNWIIRLEHLDANTPNISRPTIPIGFDKKIDRYNYGGTLCDCWLVFYTGENFTGDSLSRPIDYNFIRDGYYGGYIGLGNFTFPVDSPYGGCTAIGWNNLISSYEIYCYNF